ncbi:hypothetical protein [Frankia sp. CcWB2]
MNAGEVAAITSLPEREIGANAVDQIVNKLTGRPVETVVNLDFALYTKESLAKAGVSLGNALAKC